MAEPACEKCTRTGLALRNGRLQEGKCITHFLMAEREADGRYHHDGLSLDGERFEGATIKEVTFDGPVSFDHSVLGGTVWFVNCVFADSFDLTAVKSDGWIRFHDCHFGGSVNFNLTESAYLLITRSEFDASTELRMSRTDVSLHQTTFAGRARLVGVPRSLELQEIDFRGAASLRLSSSVVTLNGVELGALSSLSYQKYFDTQPGLFLRMDRNYPKDLVQSDPRLLRIAGTDLSRFSVFDTDLRFCSFVDTHNLDALVMESLPSFQWSPRGAHTRRRVLWDEILYRAYVLQEPAWQKLAHQEDAPETESSKLPKSAAEVARTYRALRKAREDAKDEPGAADFYYGEMEMRRISRRIELVEAARQRAWGECATAAAEHTLLWVYWAASGYGLRAWRALTTLVIILLGTSVIFRYAGFPGDTHTYAASVRFAVQSAMSLVRGTDETLTPTGEWVALALRLLGPLLFGLALLAMRGRLRR